jgi:hypothetical protein
MGTYLSTPKTDKVSDDGENENLRFGSSAMQGWRQSMEDAVCVHFLKSLNPKFCPPPPKLMQILRVLSSKKKKKRTNASCFFTAKYLNSDAIENLS